MNVIHEHYNAGRGEGGKGQTTVLERIVSDGERKFRVTVRRDHSYDFQSHSQVYFWNGSDWAGVATGGATATALSDTADIADYLLTVAAEVVA